MTTPPVAIIIPSWNNPQYLRAAVTSLIHNCATENLFHIYVVNNGHPKSCDFIDSPYVTVIQTGGINLGWEGALKRAVAETTSPFLCFFNDDAYIPASSRLWLNHLLQHFRDEHIGAIGPSSNVVMGMQNIFAQVPFAIYSARFLIGFCMLIRRSALEKVGGIDDSLPGGDDLDLSIRLRQAGYALLVDRDIFVYHHGFKTGERIHGTSDRSGGWNSYEFRQKTDFALIQKHGFRAWWECMNGVYAFAPMQERPETPPDREGEIIRQLLTPGTILDLGCGANKTSPEAIGVDMIPKNQPILSLGHKQVSQADVTADITHRLPFVREYADTIIARHVLEHMLDPISAIRTWSETLKPGGRLIIAVPNEQKINTIPMNIEHVHAWDPPAMKALLETVGYTVTDQFDGQNDVSFITIGVKA